MKTKRLVWVVALFVVLSACGDSSSGTTDSGLGGCEDGGSAADCEGSQPPRQDGSVDDSGAPGDEDASDVDEPDAMQVDESAEPDGSVDEGVEPDANVAIDSGVDAAVVDAMPNCRDDYECGYGTCLEAQELPSCQCAVGYRDDGAGCVWAGDGETGGVADGELDDPSAWLSTNVVIAGGVARFDSVGAGDSCEVGVLQQTLQMPARAASQALVLEMDVLSSCTNSDPEECAALQLELGASASRLVVAGAPGASAAAPVARTISRCLGQAGYGPDTRLKVRPALAYRHGEQPLACETTEWPAIDRIAIRPAAAGECAADDAVRDSVPTATGWSFVNATVAADRVMIAQGGSAETMVAFSQAPSGQALHIGWSSDQPSGTVILVDIMLDGLLWRRVRVATTMQLCMPQWAAGASHTLTIAPATHAIGVRQLEIVSNPDCDDNVFDATFDRPIAQGSWSAMDDRAGVVIGHEENGVGVYTSSNALRASFRFPAREPAYRFGLHAWHRNMYLQTTTFDFVLAASAGVTATSGSWQEHVECVPHRWEHQLVTLRGNLTMTANAAGGMTQTNFDDLGLRMVLQTDCQ